MNIDIEQKMKEVNSNLSTSLTLAKILLVSMNNPKNLDNNDLAKLAFELEMKLNETSHIQKELIDNLNI